MSNAYKCDSCDELNEGTPTKFRVTTGTYNMLGWNKDNIVAATDLCDDCADAFKDVVTSYK